MNLRTLYPFLATTLALAFLPSCDDDEEDDGSADETTGFAGTGTGTSTSGTGTSTSTGTGTSTGTSTGTDTGTTGTETGDPVCAADAPIEMITADSITANTTWTCDRRYVLTVPVHVENNAILTVEAGTTVLAQSGTYLLIARGSQLQSLGTVDAPVTFTSSQAAGGRARGDWGGIVLNGSATNNLPGGEGNSEGIPPGARSVYGGIDDASSCGTLEYTRVSFAGFELTPDNELNGISFNSCGMGTVVDHVQVHMSDDDGIEMFGGTWNGKHIVVTGTADDGIDTDEGYRGKLQYVFVQQDPTIGNNAYEHANYNNDHAAVPLHHIEIANATLIGVGAAAGSSSAGPQFKEGASGWVQSSIVMNFENKALSVVNEATEGLVGTTILVKNSLFFNNAIASGGTDLWGVSEGSTFDLGAYVTDPTNANVMNVDPMLTSTAWGSPNIAPMAGSPVLGAGTLAADAFFEATTYIGAVESAATDWTLGWTDFAAN